MKTLAWIMLIGLLLWLVTIFPILLLIGAIWMLIAYLSSEY
jgi:hypothetical protein